MTNDFWAEPWPYDPGRPPVTDRDLAAWEQRYGLRLPQRLAAALRLQDGGIPRDTDVLIRPLAEMMPLAADRWEHMGDYETNRAFGDPARLVLFAEFDPFPISLVLDYNVGTDPRVLQLHHNLGDELRDAGDGSFDDLLAASADGARDESS